MAKAKMIKPMPQVDLTLEWEEAAALVALLYKGVEANHVYAGYLRPVMEAITEAISLTPSEMGKDFCVASRSVEIEDAPLEDF